MSFNWLTSQSCYFSMGASKPLNHNSPGIQYMRNRIMWVNGWVITSRSSPAHSVGAATAGRRVHQPFSPVGLDLELLNWALEVP